MNNSKTNSFSELVLLPTVEEFSSSFPDKSLFLIGGIPADAQFQQVSEKYLLDTNGVLYEYQYDYETDTFRGEKLWRMWTPLTNMEMKKMNGLWMY